MIKAYLTDLNSNIHLKEVKPAEAVADYYLRDIAISKKFNWEGFGGAFTEAAGYNYSYLSPQNKKEVIDAYFSSDGLNYDLGRLCIGSSDFSLSCYDYYEYNSLNYQREADYVEPLIKAALEKKKKLSFLASPWSPPARFKDNQTRANGGTLLKEYYKDYAKYLASYLFDKRIKRIDIKYLTIQNEPAATQIWDSCLYSSEEEYELAKELLAHLKGTSIKPKIMLWDHNRDIAYERLAPIFEKDGGKLIYGGAIHWYDNEDMKGIYALKENYPKMRIFHTESCLEGGPHMGEVYGLERYARNIILDINAGVEAFIDWNLFLDLEGGPNWVGNFCSAPILVDKEEGGYYLMPSYYAIYHFAHFIKKDAKLVLLERPTNANLFSCCLKNKSGEFVYVVLNQGENAVKVGMSSYAYTIPAHSLLTIIRKGKI